MRKNKTYRRKKSYRKKTYHKKSHKKYKNKKNLKNSKQSGGALAQLLMSTFGPTLALMAKESAEKLGKSVVNSISKSFMNYLIKGTSVENKEEIISYIKDKKEVVSAIFLQKLKENGYGKLVDTTSHYEKASEIRRLLKSGELKRIIEETIKDPRLKSEIFNDDLYQKASNLANIKKKSFTSRITSGIKKRIPKSLRRFFSNRKSKNLMKKNIDDIQKNMIQNKLDMIDTTQDYEMSELDVD